MTYTAEKILANFLSIEEGLLSKRYIDLCKLFYGENVGKVAYIATLSASSRDFLMEDWCYVPVPVSVSNHRDLVFDCARKWFPGRFIFLSTINGFHIYRGTRFNQQSNGDCHQTLESHLTSPESVIRTLPSSDHKMAYRYMFYESLYDRVSAQSYTKPAVGRDTDSFILKTLTETPLLSRELWVDPKVLSTDDVRNLTSYT